VILRKAEKKNNNNNKLLIHPDWTEKVTQMKSSPIQQKQIATSKETIHKVFFNSMEEWGTFTFVVVFSFVLRINLFFFSHLV